MKVIESNYFIIFPLISIPMIGVGLILKRYLKKIRSNAQREILVVGTGIFFITFLANALIVIGVFCLLTACVTFFFYLEYEGYI